MNKNKTIELIDEFLENYIKYHKSLGTYKTYKYSFVFWKKYSENILEQKKLNSFIENNYKELKINKTQIASLKSFLKWLNKVHPETECNASYLDLPKNSDEITKVKTYKTIDEDELNTILEVVINNSKPDTGLVFAFYAYFQYYSGLRVSELVENKIEDMVPRNKHSQYKIIGKGNKERIMFVKDFLVHVKFKEPYNNINKFSEMFHYIKKLKESGKYKNLWSVSYYKKLIINANKKCLKINECFPHFSSHNFRYSFAYRLAENNVPITAIKTFLGHSNINTTAIYIQQSESDLEFYYSLTSFNVIKNCNLEFYQNDINLLKKTLHKVIKMLQKYEKIDLPIILEETKKEIEKDKCITTEK